jgi:riboflavin synthase
VFTGLVERQGIVTEITDRVPAAKLTIDAGPIAQESKPGDSIAVNGCCLTVTEILGTGLAFDVVPETLQRTSLGALSVGQRVNLERPLRLGDSLGGHLVSGHIDGIGTVAARTDDGECSTMWIAVAPGLARQMAPKGSVALDGVSLTLVDVEDRRFSVALIPHTLSATTLGTKGVGDRVNVETDLLAKYIERQLRVAGVIGHEN